MTNTVPRLIQTIRAHRAGVSPLRLYVPCGPIEIVADNTTTHTVVAFEGSTPDTCDMIGEIEIDNTDDGLSIHMRGPDSDVSTGVMRISRIDLRTTVRIPPNSPVKVVSVSGNIQANHVHAVELRSDSGNVVVHAVATARVESVTGNVSINNLAGTATVNNVTGNITTHSTGDSRVCANTVTGNITTGRSDTSVKVDLQANTVTGSIRP